MINLIPQVAKDKIISEYWVRVVSVWLFIISITSIVVLLLLLPVYVLVTSKVSAYSTSANEGAGKVAEYAASASALTQVNNQAQMLLESGKAKQFSELAAAISELEGSDITINEFNFHRSGIVPESVQMNGEATTRQALASFRDSLMLLPWVKDVNLPISNLAKDRDITFNISIVLKDEEDKI